MKSKGHHNKILAVDIGNTTIALAVVEGLNVIQSWHVDSDLSKSELRAKLRSVVRSIARRYPGFRQIVVCSVVPGVLTVVQSVLKSESRLTPVVVGKDVRVPIVNRYSNPGQVGQDRLVCAYAAKMLYGFPVIVIDLGTAITLEAVSAKGEYLGGAIVPGIRLSAESLFRKTAMLPKIKIKGPKNIIGKNTQESILSGLFYGFGALCRGMIEEMSRQVKGHPNVVMTGGHALLMRKYISPRAHLVDHDLVFKGLALISSLLKFPSK